MPDPTRTHRGFLPSTIQALTELEERRGKPELNLEEPELVVSATIRRSGTGQASYILRWRCGTNSVAN